MIRRLQTESDAREILDQFNGFHDGFIKQLSLPGIRVSMHSG